MDYRKVMLLELPVPDAHLSPELAAAATSLGQAQQAMARGDYREAVGLCRDVLEEIMRALKDDDNIDFSGAREMDKAKRPSAASPRGKSVYPSGTPPRRGDSLIRVEPHRCSVNNFNRRRPTQRACCAWRPLER